MMPAALSRVKGFGDASASAALATANVAMKVVMQTAYARTDKPCFSPMKVVSAVYLNGERLKLLQRLKHKQPLDARTNSCRRNYSAFSVRQCTMRATVFPLPQWSRWRCWNSFPRDCFVSQGEKHMRTLLFGIALSAATVFASSSYAAWAVCAAGYKAEPKMINGSENTASPTPARAEGRAEAHLLRPISPGRARRAATACRPCP